VSARQFGKIPRTRWAEEWWTSLTADAQWLHSFLISQPTTDSAGIFPIRITKWAKGAVDMTVERVQAAARQLVEGGVIVPDHDTEEGLIRNYIRDDWAGDNIFKGALGRAVLCQSALLRAVLLHEIENLGREMKPEWLLLVADLRDSIPPDLDWELLLTSPAPSSTATTQAFKRRSDAVPEIRNNGDGPFAGSVPVGSVRLSTPVGKREARVAFCPQCGAEFEAKDPRAKYCSDACRQAAYRERSQS
jgi:hypothetical protein